MKRFAPNIDTKGRVIRGLVALVLLTAGVLMWFVHYIPSLLLCGSAAFVFFEAGRGWCALRACGLKTKF